MKILFLGDSITAGNRGDAVGYPVYIEKILKEKYPHRSFEFVNKAVWGDETVNLYQAITSDEKLLQNCDLILLMIGTNDVLKHFDDKSLACEEFELRYQKVVAETKKYGCPLVIIEPYIIFDDPMRSYKRKLLTQFNEIVFKIAKKYADAFVPLDGILKSVAIIDDITTYTVDGLHLSDKGAKFIAEKCIDICNFLIK